MSTELINAIILEAMYQASVLSDYNRTRWYMELPKTIMGGNYPP